MTILIKDCTMKRKKINVKHKKNIVKVYNLNHIKVVSDFIRILNAIFEQGYKEITIDFTNVEKGHFPCAIVPISGIIEELINQGVIIKVCNNSQTETMNLKQPLLYKKGEKFIFSKVWKFDNTNNPIIVEDFINELTKVDNFPKNVIVLTEWVLNEVIDNVINHSGKEGGYVMGQVHPSTKHITFCIFDNGIGIKESFIQGGLHSPKNQADAISLAIKEGVTSNKSKGQGNGLFGLHSMVSKGDGKLNIVSGSGGYCYYKNIPTFFKSLPILKNRDGCTTIDFMIDYSQDYYVENVLTFNGKPYKPINLRIENMEDERGNILFKIKELGEGTGTRMSATRLKNQIMNILNEEPKNIVLDFSDIGVISSSYADELIAKLLLELGLFQFNQLIRLRHLNETQQTILQRSVIQRFVDVYNDNNYEKRTI